MAPLVGSSLGAPTSMQDLRAGMVVFCTKPSLLQRCNDLAGDHWRHAGLLIDTPDGLMMCGFALKKNYCLIPAEKLATYSRVGIANVLTDDQVTALHSWVGQFEEKPNTYVPASLPMVGLLSWARTLAPGAFRKLIVAICIRYCLRLSRRYRDRVAFICSTFVYTALNAAREQPLHLPMTADKVDHDRYVDAVSTDDVLLSRWLASPSDLWRSIPVALRSELVVGESADVCASTSNITDPLDTLTDFDELVAGGVRPCLVRFDLGGDPPRTDITWSYRPADGHHDAEFEPQYAMI